MKYIESEFSTFSRLTRCRATSQCSNQPTQTLTLKFHYQVLLDVNTAKRDIMCRAAVQEWTHPHRVPACIWLSGLCSSTLRDGPAVLDGQLSNIIAVATIQPSKLRFLMHSKDLSQPHWNERMMSQPASAERRAAGESTILCTQRSMFRMSCPMSNTSDSTIVKKICTGDQGLRASRSTRRQCVH